MLVYSASEQFVVVKIIIVIIVIIINVIAMLAASEAYCLRQIRT